MSNGRTGRANLDPTDWPAFRTLAHQALNDMIDHIETLRERPVWVAAPEEVRGQFAQDLPRSEGSFAEALDDFQRLIKPYATGNGHPAFMGWVHGAGTPVGMVAEMLAAGLNANCGGRNHIAIDVERQITLWMRQAFDFPSGTAGLFVTGASMANFLGLLVARNRRLGVAVRKMGLNGARLTAYASAGAHGCIAQAMELSGIGFDALRLVPCDAEGALKLDDLCTMVEADRRSGLAPFLVVGTAGSVDIGAIDPLAALAEFCVERDLWFHVDGAFGALLAFCQRLRPLIAGVERADSVAFDFHKWTHVPYDAGFLLVRDGEALRQTFASTPNYLTRASTGLAAGGVWPCDLGPDLSRGFRALKTWFTLRVFGADLLGECIAQTCEMAQRLAAHIEASPRFVLRAPVRLNIVCFSVLSDDPDADNRAIVERLHVSGQAAPSITIRHGVAVIRCAFVNHRTTAFDVDSFFRALETVADGAINRLKAPSRSG
jgi:aromatic-L-amino-acid/L-tryptophan decarboxylase